MTKFQINIQKRNNEIINHYWEGVDIREIAEGYGIGVRMTRRIIRKMKKQS